MVKYLESLLTHVVAIAACVFVFFALHWLGCRVTARRCPACGSKWRTELEGEWGGDEDWRCHACGHAWIHENQ